MSTPVEEGSFKQYCFMEGAESKDLTHFFRLPTILPSWLPRTTDEFVVVISTKDQNFFRSLSVSDRRRLLEMLPEPYFGLNQ